MQFVKMTGLRGGVSFMLVLGWAVGAAYSPPVWLYAMLPALLLAVGLFGATSGIEAADMRRREWVLIFKVVLIGVALKTVFITVAMAAVTHEWAYGALAITMAQIDPLSVGALHNRLSNEGDRVLRLWSSFDDPVTVLLVVAAIALQNLGTVNLGLADTSTFTASNLAELGIYLCVNAALFSGMWLLWRLTGRWIAGSVAAVTLLAVAAIAAGAWHYAMLAVAASGLLCAFKLQRLRQTHVFERLNSYAGITAKAAFCIAGGLCGTIAAQHGVHVGAGIMLGIAAFASQAFVTPLLTRGHGLARSDVYRLMISQQNGITAILLALAIGPEAVAAAIPAIITTHVLYAASNAVYNRRARPESIAAPNTEPA